MGLSCWCWRTAGAMGLLAMILTFPGQASAEVAHNEARQHFERGRQLEQAGDTPGALREFELAHELRPSFRLRRHIGRACESLGRLSEALNHYQAYLNDGGARVGARDRRAVQRSITNLEPRLASLQVTTSEGATISLNGDIIGTAPLESPLPVDPGELHLEVRLDQHLPFVTRQTAAEGEAVVVEAELVPLAEETPTTGEIDPDSDPSGRDARSHRRRVHRAWFWATFGITAALAVGGAACGGLALVRQQEFDDLDRPGRTDDENANLADIGQSGTTFQILSDALLFSGAAMAIVVVVLAVFTDFEGGIPRARESSDVSMRFAPGGLSLQWRPQW